MKEQLKKLSEPAEIFVDIRETDIVIPDPYKGKSVEIKDFVMLHSSTGYFHKGDDINFLGLNRVFKEVREGKKNLELGRKSFWLRNSELFACMCSVVYAWVDTEKRKLFPGPDDDFLPDTWMKLLKPDVVTIYPSYNWFGIIIDISRIKECFSEELSQLIENLHEKGFSLKLLSENGLGNNNSANIYFQISYIKPKNGCLILGDNYLNYNSLTLEKTNFKVEFGQNPQKLFHYFKGKISISNLAQELEKYSKDFLRSGIHFNSLYDLMSRENLNEMSYNALLLDLHDRNRNESSVDLDDRLRNLLKKTILKGHDIRNKNGSVYTWAHLIESVVNNNAVELATKVKNDPYQITDFFSKKRVIQKMERIHYAILKRKDPEMMRKYIDKQVESYKEVLRHISDNNIDNASI
jgi:hypothetical protein